MSSSGYVSVMGVAAAAVLAHYLRDRTRDCFKERIKADGRNESRSLFLRRMQSFAYCSEHTKMVLMLMFQAGKYTGAYPVHKKWNFCFFLSVDRFEDWLKI